MTLIELTFFVVMILIGIGSSKIFYSLGGYWLGVPGFFFGVLIIPGIMFAHAKYRKWAYLGDKWMPDCKCGSAEFVYEMVAGRVQLFCKKCRTRYQKQKDQVFIFVNETRQPYAKLVKHQGWTREDSQQGAPANGSDTGVPEP